MKRIFAKYTEWEDYQNGMYDMYNEDHEEMIRKSMSLLKDTDLFLKISQEVVKNWPISTKVHLTNKTINKKAWIGQASCCYHHKVPELLTRVAWGKLTKYEQDAANNVAERVINSFLYNFQNGKGNLKLH